MSPWLTLIILVFLLQTALHLLSHLLHRLRPRHHAPAMRPSLWANIPRFYRHFITNLAVGWGIFFLLMPFHHYPWLMNIEDASMDWIMQIRQQVIPLLDDPDKPEKIVPSLVLLDIDDETYQDWEEPLFTPRDRLKNLIDVAINAEPRLIVIDIDVSQKMSMAGLETCAPSLTLHPHDQALQAYLQKYSADCQAQRRTLCPPIIFARAFQYIETEEHTETGKPQKKEEVKIRPSFLEETFANSAFHLQWASTIFYQSADQVIRRWALWQVVKNDPHPLQVVPSVELLAAALIKNGIMPETRTELEKTLLAFEQQNIKEAHDSHVAKTPEITIGSLTVHAGPLGIHQRIIYGMPWKPKQTQPGISLRYTLSDERGNIALAVFSAKNFATATPEPLKAKNEVIIIGGSRREGRDIYATPLGLMPGMLILANAIHSILEYEEPDPLEKWQKLIIEGILILLMSAAFAYWEESFWAMLFSTLVIILVLLPASIIFFGYGLWLDFAIPLLTVFLHQLAAEFEKLQKGKSEELNAEG